MGLVRILFSRRVTFGNVYGFSKYFLTVLVIDFHGGRQNDYICSHFTHIKRIVENEFIELTRATTSVAIAQREINAVRANPISISIEYLST